VTREAVVAEGVEGGYAATYPILRAMEEAGGIRRGYFVEGLGAAQFALSGALERLRTVREPAPGEPLVHLLAATDPAQPYGAALPWPRRGEDDRRPLQRAAGAYVVVIDGVAAAYLERGGASLQLLPAADDPEVLRLVVTALRNLVADGRVRELVIKRVDGEPVSTSVRREDLLTAGFVPGYRGLTLRRG
jgi:ATP-dependent Lhr-like helicase